MELRKFKFSPLQKGTKLYSIVKLKCPRCHQGPLFSVPNAYHLRKVLNMPERCPVCGQDFRIEPGFYAGALWTSFPLIIIITFALSLLFLGWLQLSLNLFFILLALSLLILQPLVMRWGRAIWINIFVSFDAPHSKEGFR